MPGDELLEQRLVRVEQKLDDIGTALQSLIRIEERQAHTSQQIAAFASDVRALQERVRELELAVPENLSKRLAAIEVALPGLKELRRWVVGGVLAGVGMIGTALVSLVITFPKG